MEDSIVRCTKVVRGSASGVSADRSTAVQVGYQCVKYINMILLEFPRTSFLGLQYLIFRYVVVMVGAVADACALKSLILAKFAEGVKETVNTDRIRPTDQRHDLCRRTITLGTLELETLDLLLR